MWFGKRWLGFSGKALGAIGVPKGKRLHVWQRSAENLQRYSEVILWDANAFWYTGRSAKNDRASVMAYVSTPDGHWPWYVGLRRKEKRQVVESIGIGLPEIETFTHRGLEHLRETDRTRSV